MERGTIIDRLEGHALARGEKVALRHLTQGRPQGPVDEMSFQALAARARTLARMLREAGHRHRTVLLLYPSGNEFVAAFLGCLYGGAIAVPAYPPDPHRLNRTLPRLQAIARDSQADLILTVREFRDLAPQISSSAPGLAELEWIATDEIATDAQAEVSPPDGDGIAFLQYTSGSTGDPKGVMVSYANLRHNAAMMDAAWPGGCQHRFVCWLPLYHDMGLIANLMQTVEMGASCTLLTPLQFLARPRCWLEALSHFRATISMAPNFAYDLCLRKVGKEQLEGLSLESWKVAVNAAEPTRLQTMERFAERFGPVGFRKETFQATFGLAETTVFATARGSGRRLRSMSVLAGELSKDRVVETDAEGRGVLRFASHGRSWLDQEFRLVDPKSCRLTQPGRVGEIWLGGPSVACGYWQRPEATEATFGARLADSGEGPYLRSGDLGFMADGELYIVGRIKDVIIYHGANFYPQDIERTAREAHGSVRPGCVVAFGVDDGSAERLVVVAEVYNQSGLRGEEIAEAIGHRIFDKHDIPLDILILIAPKTTCKTSSGKLQRHRSRAAFLNGELEEVYRWESPRVRAENQAPDGAAATQPAAKSLSGPISAQARELSAFIFDWLCRNLPMDRRELDPSTPFADLGLDSVAGVELAHHLGERLGRDLDHALVWKLPTIDALARHLAGASDPRRKGAAGAGTAGISAELEELSVEELEQILAGELQGK